MLPIQDIIQFLTQHADVQFCEGLNSDSPRATAINLRMVELFWRFHYRVEEPSDNADLGGES